MIENMSTDEKEYYDAVKDMTESERKWIFPNNGNLHKSIAVSVIMETAKDEVIIYDKDLKGFEETDYFFNSLYRYDNFKKGKILKIITYEDISPKMSMTLEMFDKRYPNQLFLSKMDNFLDNFTSIVTGDNYMFRLEQNKEKADKDKYIGGICCMYNELPQH